MILVLNSNFNAISACIVAVSWLRKPEYMKKATDLP
jgi:hypothetical protein